MSSPASDLYVEVQVSDKQPGASDETRKSQKMSKGAAFDATRALRGIGSTGESATADSACKVRGDGRYANGTNFLREGNKVHIGPEAFTANNLEETMQQLNRFGAFGTKGDLGEGSAETATRGNEKNDRVASRASVASAPSSGGLNLQMVRDLETILTLSEQQSKATKLEDSQSAMYNIDDSDEEEEEVEGAGVRARQAEKKVPQYEARWLPNEENPSKFEMRVSMPETSSIGKVSLQVESTKQQGRVLSLSSPTYHLKVPVDGARGGAGKAQSLKPRAKWLKEKKVLKVTLAV